MRQWLIDAWQLEIYTSLQDSTDSRLAAIAAKALKETRYHYRFSSGWLVRLGDGTAESHERVQSAVDELWRFTGELFAPDEVDERMAAAGIAPPLSTAEARWSARVDEDLRAATPQAPAPRSPTPGMASAACIPNTWGTCSPRCSTCSAPIRARAGRHGRMSAVITDAGIAAREREVWELLGEVPDPEIPVLSHRGPGHRASRAAADPMGA